MKKKITNMFRVVRDIRSGEELLYDYSGHQTNQNQTGTKYIPEHYVVHKERTINLSLFHLTSDGLVVPSINIKYTIINIQSFFL